MTLSRLWRRSWILSMASRCCDTIGKVTSVDADGDAEVHLPSLVPLYPCERRRWILAESLNKSAKYGGTAIESKKAHGDVT